MGPDRRRRGRSFGLRLKIRRPCEALACAVRAGGRARPGETPFPWQEQLLARFMAGAVDRSLDICGPWEDRRHGDLVCRAGAWRGFASTARLCRGESNAPSDFGCSDHTRASPAGSFTCAGRCLVHDFARGAHRATGDRSLAPRLDRRRSAADGRGLADTSACAHSRHQQRSRARSVVP